MNASRRKWFIAGSIVALTGVLGIAIAWPRFVHAVGGASSREPEDLAHALSPEARALVDAAFADLRGAPLVDYHVHVAGLGTGGSGCEVNEKLRSWAHPKQHVQFQIYMDAARVDDLSHADEQYIARLLRLARGFPHPWRGGVLAFEHHCDELGAIVADESEMYVPNDYVLRLARESPDVLRPVASIHPYRSDAVRELERVAASGVRLVKWLPNEMGIDPADPRCDAYYDAMARLGLALLSHAGDEQAVDAHDAQKLGNPLRLRRALDHGVKVIIAHCASTGNGEDLDDPAHGTVSNFDLFLRVMDDPRYVGRAFGEISALTQRNRSGHPLRTMLERTDLHARLVNGSDYPLPAINVLFSTSQLADAGYITARDAELLNEIYDVNPLLFDYVSKRTLRHPSKHTRFAPEIFVGHTELGP